jgi:hypothetical protein
MQEAEVITVTTKLEDMYTYQTLLVLFKASYKVITLCESEMCKNNKSSPSNVKICKLK